MEEMLDFEQNTTYSDIQGNTTYLSDVGPVALSCNDNNPGMYDNDSFYSFEGHKFISLWLLHLVITITLSLVRENHQIFLTFEKRRLTSLSC